MNVDDDFGSQEPLEAIATATIYFTGDERDEVEIPFHSKESLDGFLKLINEVHAEHKTLVHYEDEPDNAGEQKAHFIPQRRVHHIKVIKNTKLVAAAGLEEQLAKPAATPPAPGVARPTASTPHRHGATPHTSPAASPEVSGFLVGGDDEEPAVPPTIPTQPVGATAGGPNRHLPE